MNQQFVKALVEKTLDLHRMIAKLNQGLTGGILKLSEVAPRLKELKAQLDLISELVNDEEMVEDGWTNRGGYWSKPAAPCKRLP